MNPKFIDIHSHINFAAYDEDRDDVILRTKEGETLMINVGTKESTSKEAVELAEANEGVYAIIGLHPIHTNASFHDKDEIGEEGEPFKSKGEEFNLDFYNELVKSDKVVGVGECGLDYFRIEGDEKEYKDRQEKAFRAQIEFALEHNLPLMIHCRDAYPEVLNILREYKEKTGDKLRGNFHFFAGTKEEAQEILDLGFNMSFTGVITFAKDYEELVKMIPLERMFSETDCPYVTPVPYRGKRNEPLYVSEVVKKIAEIKEIDIEKTRAQLLQNALDFFKLK
jgi:TatD DNase family protein